MIDQATTERDYSLSQQQLKNQLIIELLHGAVKDEAVILSRAKHLDIDLNPPRAVILIKATRLHIRSWWRPEQSNNRSRTTATNTVCN